MLSNFENILQVVAGREQIPMTQAPCRNAIAGGRIIFPASLNRAHQSRIYLAITEGFRLGNNEPIRLCDPAGTNYAYVTMSAESTPPLSNNGGSAHSAASAGKRVQNIVGESKSHGSTATPRRVKRAFSSVTLTTARSNA